MKNLAIVLISAFTVSLLASCEKCYTCSTDSFGTSEQAEICRKKKDVEAEIENLEANGYTCTEQ